MVTLHAYENGGFERLWKWWLWTPMKIVALNAYENGSFECLWKWWLWAPMKMMTLNAYKMVALNAYENGGSERLWKWWLWTPMKMGMTLKAYENEGGFERLWKWWVWTPSCEEMMRGKMPQCGVSSQISIHWKGLKETPWVSKDALSMSHNGQINYKITSHNPSD